MPKVVELTTEKIGVAKEFYPDFDVIMYNPVRGKSTKLPYRNEELHGIFAHHILNKIGWRQTVPSVLDWARCLRDGGLLHIIVPSQRWIGRALLQEEIDPHVMPALWGSQDSKYNFNKSSHSLLGIRRLMERASLGIVKAKIGIFSMEIDGEMYDAEQLYVCGQKFDFAGQRQKLEVEGEFDELLQ